MAPSTQLFVARHADNAWREVIRPWLEEGRGRLGRSFVIVATRGQSQALKQRCVEEGVALLGVEFLTPGLARQKWLALEPEPRPAMGRELLLLGLRTLVERRKQSTDPANGFWKSLYSDADRALDDFDELLKAGYRAADHPLAPMRDVFMELTDWVDAHGYALAPLVAEGAGTRCLVPGGPLIGGRVLACCLGPEAWGEVFNVAAFLRRCDAVTMVLPEPEFAGRHTQDEQWVARWADMLQTEAEPIVALPPDNTCESVGALWLHPTGEARRARVLVGRTRRDEMHLVANHVGALLASGAENIGVIFPEADAAYLDLCRHLADGAVPFSDQIGIIGPPPVDVQAQRALLLFQERGARLEELFALWPLLQAVGVTALSRGEVRRAMERAFDARQTHRVTAYLEDWKQRAPELARIVAVLLPPWPPELTLADALRSFRAACDAVDLAEPEGLSPLDVFAERHLDPLPLAVVTATLASFLPDKQRGTSASGFARVTLTTRRRAEGVAWSHLILVQSNAEVWPRRRETSCWLTDEHRVALNGRPGEARYLLTADDRAAVERTALAGLARDTRHEVIFSAALVAEDDPEARLTPNAWLERVLWAQNSNPKKGDVLALFEHGAVAIPPAPPAKAPIDNWREIWLRRRDPTRPFDEFFFAGDPAKITPPRLSPRQIERGVQDPAEFWFEAVLGLQRVEWAPFARARRKALGLRAHELLAAALQPARLATRHFGEMPDRETACRSLQTVLAEYRAQWPVDRYWDSFFGELAHVARVLLENVYELPAGSFVATEATLPAEAHLILNGRPMAVSGRMDLVRLDQPDWRGASADIIDFKTGGDADLSAERMGRTGVSLQLGVYLEAVRSLGCAAARVWMVKPVAGEMTSLDFSTMAVALEKLRWLETALRRGVFGALTRDRSDYAPAGWNWPLACTPVPHVVLAEKFRLTFDVRGGGGCDA